MDNDLNTTDAPTQRILIIAETIARYGPITLAQLTERVQFSRGAIWRAVSTMRAQGWVRMRLGDNAYELRSGFIDLLSQARPSLPEMDHFESLMLHAGKAGAVYVDLCQFYQSGLCKIIESTRKQLPPGNLSLCDDDLAIAAQLQMTPKDLVTHLRSYITFASDEERRTITSGEHGRHLARLRDNGVVWLDDRTSVAFPIKGHIGFALRAELWRTTRADVEVFVSHMTDMISAPQLATAARPAPVKRGQS